MKYVLLNIILFILLQSTYVYSKQDTLIAVQDDRIQCYCHPEDRTVAQYTIDIIFDALPDIEKQYGLQQKKLITILIAGTNTEFANLTQNQIPDWGTGAADPQRSVIYLKSPRISDSGREFSAILLHELSHVLLGQVDVNRTVHRWFDEGLAMNVAREGNFWDTWQLIRAVQTDQLIYLQHIDQVLRFQKTKAALAYQESRRAVDMLSQVFGTDVYETIVHKMESGLVWSDAFEQATQMPIGAYETLFLDDLHQRYRWFFILDFPVNFSIILVVLFLAAFVMKRRQAKKQMEIWEGSLDSE